MCPKRRVVKKEKFSMIRLLHKLVRKLFPEDAVKNVVEDQEKEGLEDEDDVNGIRLLTY